MRAQQVKAAVVWEESLSWETVPLYAKPKVRSLSARKERAPVRCWAGLASVSHLAARRSREMDSLEVVVYRRWKSPRRKQLFGRKAQHAVCFE